MAPTNNRNPGPPKVPKAKVRSDLPQNVQSKVTNKTSQLSHVTKPSRAIHELRNAASNLNKVMNDTRKVVNTVIRFNKAMQDWPKVKEKASNVIEDVDKKVKEAMEAPGYSVNIRSVSEYSHFSDDSKYANAAADSNDAKDVNNTNGASKVSGANKVNGITEVNARYTTSPKKNVTRVEKRKKGSESFPLKLVKTLCKRIESGLPI